MPRLLATRVLSRSTLRTKLILSHGFVIAVAVTTFALTVRLASPLGPHAPRAFPTAATVSAYTAKVDSSLARALLLATALSLAFGVIAAILITQLIARPLEQIRAAARYLTDGHYETRVPVPRAPELAGIATDFNALAARLHNTERRRTHLVSDLAHELRTPLTILRGRLDGFTEGIFQPSRALIGSMSEEVSRLERLTGDLSQLSRAEETAFKLRPATIDLVQLAGTVIDRLRHRYQEQGVAVSVVAGRPVVVDADPDRISQVVVNLLVNALAATDPGGRVTVSLGQTATTTSLRVTDTGCGIHPDDLQRIFERFERLLPEGRPEPYNGSGIGLTIARAIARAHHGELRAHSDGPGTGAVFTLVLPGPPHPPEKDCRE